MGGKKQTIIDCTKALIIIIAPVLIVVWYQKTYSLLYIIIISLWALAVIVVIRIDRKLRISVINRKIQAHAQALEKAKFRLEEAYRVNQQINSLDTCIAERIPENANGLDSSETINQIFELDKCMSELIAHIYYFYVHDPRRQTNQQYRVTFMVPENDGEMVIKYFQTQRGEAPISYKRRKVFAKNLETIAGCVWVTMQPLKIGNIDEHLKNQKPGECYFNIIHQEQRRNIKSIFSIPVYAEPQHGAPFYGVLNIDTDIIGRFKPIGISEKDYQLEIIKPFIKRIGYLYKINNFLSQIN